jgi:glycosyltransferase involved in cell wall biosynthesis
MKKVSVILSSYNSEKTIENTVNSIIGQEGNGTEFEIELIVIDDCSTDSTYSILKKMKCILLKNNKNSGGPNKGRNVGLKMATGDFICIVDHDDIWEVNKIKTLLPHLELVPIVTSGYKILDIKNNKEIDKVNKNENNYIYYETNKTFLKLLSRSLKGQKTYLGSIIYRKELKDILFEENFGQVDYDWILKIFHQRPSIEVCQTLYKRIVHGSNLSMNENHRKYDFYYSLMTFEEYQKDYPSEVSVAYKKMYGNRARYYYILDDMKKARFYFLKSNFNLKTLLYYITSFVGYKLVKKYFGLYYTFG